MAGGAIGFETQPAELLLDHFDDRSTRTTTHVLTNSHPGPAATKGPVPAHGARIFNSKKKIETFSKIPYFCELMPTVVELRSELGFSPGCERLPVEPPTMEALSATVSRLITIACGVFDALQVHGQSINGWTVWLGEADGPLEPLRAGAVSLARFGPGKKVRLENDRRTLRAAKRLLERPPRRTS